MTDNKLNFSDELKLRIDRVIRWDNYRINQLSYLNNLLITLNLGFIGFFISMSDLKFTDYCWLTAFFIITLSLLLISLFAGTLTAYNRLLDFNLTSRLTKKRKSVYQNKITEDKCPNIEETKREIKYLKEKTRNLGKKTWKLINWQMWCFFSGTFIGVLYLIIMKSLV